MINLNRAKRNTLSAECVHENSVRTVKREPKIFSNILVKASRLLMVNWLRVLWVNSRAVWPVGHQQWSETIVLMSYDRGIAKEDHVTWFVKKISTSYGNRTWRPLSRVTIASPPVHHPAEASLFLHQRRKSANKKLWIKIQFLKVLIIMETRVKSTKK